MALTRGFIALRKAQLVLRLGSIRFLDAPEPILAFFREYDGESLLCLFNLGSTPVDCALPEGGFEALDYGLPAAFRAIRPICAGLRRAVMRAATG